MKRNNLIWSLVSIVLVVLVAVGSLVAGARPNLGLDLQGGISAIYSPVLDDPDEQPENLVEVLDETIEIVRSRVDSLGVAEPDISRQGTDVLVQLPGLQDAERAQEIIGTTAQLSFRPVVGILAPGQPGYDDSPPCIIPDPAEGADGFVLNPDRPAPAPEEQGVVCAQFVDTNPLDLDTGDDTTDDTTDDPATDAPSDDATTAPATEEAPADEESPTSTETTTEEAPADEASPTEDETQSAADPDAVEVRAAQDETESVTEAPSPTEDASPTEDVTTPAEQGPQPTDPAIDITDLPSDFSSEDLEQLLQQQQGQGLAGGGFDTCGSYFEDGEDPGVPAEEVMAAQLEAAPAVDLPEGAPEPIKYQVCSAPLTGDNIEDARPQLGAGWSTSLDLDGPGGDAFAFVTAQLACDRDQGGLGSFAIVLDDVVESAPGVVETIACGVGITGGSAQITVGGSTIEEQEEEAIDLSLVLRAGALPLTLEPSTFETVSPTLGSQSLRNGLLAGLIGLFLVAIYLIYFYRLLGAIAIGALSIFGILMTGVITLLGRAGFALTLAGIAGIIVSIGITADSSIIFFERIRDEISLGKTMRSAVSKSFESAFRTNLAGNTVTAAAALILYLLAVGPVRGFALTLGIATVLDIIILYFWSRPVVGLLAGNRTLKAKNVPRGADGAAAHGRYGMNTPKFDFVGQTRKWAAISITVVLISLTVLGVRGLNLSIDFVGGTSFSLEGVQNEVTADQLSDAASAAGGVDVRAQVVDDGNGALVRMGALTPGSDAAVAVEEALLEVTAAERSDFTSVGPTWGQRISNKSIQALVVFLIVVVAYISFRLQFKMAVASVIALVHDVVITIGVYAILGFSVSPNTVIALLTILGYSLYDSVVVFDRIEENTQFLGETGRRTYSQMVNLSMNEVLWRSINTSLTSLIPVGALLFLGSQLLGATTLQDLALALFVGMALGAYSSLFVAGPFLAWWKEQEPEMQQLRADAMKSAGPDAADLDAPKPEEAVAARKPITTEYVRGDGKRPRR